jgi:transcriptional regulator with XRE-family HTH domain
LDLGLLQRQVAERLGVNKGTIVNWEGNATTPALHHVPGIIRFLGYVPFQPGRSRPERLKVYRRVQGLSQKELSERIGVDESTVRRWEVARARPTRANLQRIDTLIELDF